MSRRMSFWVAAGILTCVVVSTSAPSSMYVVYQARWHFSEVMLTAVFGVYALAVLVSLMIFGPASDAVGRRPVIIGSLLTMMAGMLLFTFARNVWWLFGARILQGLGAGSALSSIGAMLLDLQPESGQELGALANVIAPNAGMVFGVLIAGTFLEYASDGANLTWHVLLGIFAVAIWSVLFMPDPRLTASERVRWSPRRVAIPLGTRKPFTIFATTSFAVFAVGGFVMSLGPSVTQQLVLHDRNHLFDGLVIVVFGVGGTATQVLLRSWSPQKSILAGTAAVIVGLGAFLYALWGGGTALFITGCVIVAAGWGLAWAGSFRALVGLADDTHRAELIAAVYLVCYLALSLPSVAAGAASALIGLRSSTLVFGIAVAALMVASALALIVGQAPSMNLTSGRLGAPELPFSTEAE